MNMNMNIFVRVKRVCALPTNYLLIVEASLLPEVNEIRGRAIKIVIFPLALREGFTTTFDGTVSTVASGFSMKSFVCFHHWFTQSLSDSFVCFPH